MLEQIQKSLWINIVGDKNLKNNVLTLILYVDNYEAYVTHIKSGLLEAARDAC